MCGVEVEAQVERFEKLVKRPPTHLDTHHHVGLHAPVRDVVLEVARALGMPVRSQDATARTRARSAGLRTPDHFFGESGPDAYWSPRPHARPSCARCRPACRSSCATPAGSTPISATAATAASARSRWPGSAGAAARGGVAALGIRLQHFGQL